MKYQPLEKLPTDKAFLHFKAARTSPGDDCSAFDSVRLIRAHEYMLKRQQELLDAALARNNQLVAAANQLTTENEKLRKELDGYKRGKLWTLLVDMMPMREMLRGEKK